MTRLSVNVNKFALLRNSRGADFPNVRRMAERAIQAGVHGITVHPRPDQRHILYRDVRELAALVREHPSVEFNIEGAPLPELLDVVAEVRPHQCTLVPDGPDQLTSDHGWNLDESGERLTPVIDGLRGAGVRVSLFLDPVPEQIEQARQAGADRIELYTEPYARAFGTPAQRAVWSRFAAAAGRARAIGLGVNAGHDLNLANLGAFLEIEGVLEVSIGHAIVVESFDFGFEETLRRYLKIVATTASG